MTPVAVAVDRSSNTDTLLVLTLLLAAWALIRAVETGRLSLLLLSAALVGVAFNVKMLAAFGVVPAFVRIYLADYLAVGERWLVPILIGMGGLTAAALLLLRRVVPSLLGGVALLSLLAIPTA